MRYVFFFCLLVTLTYCTGCFEKGQDDCSAIDPESYSCTWNGSQCVPDLSASNLKCSAIAQDDCGAVPYCNVVDNKCRLKTCLDAPDEATCNEELDSSDHACAFNDNYCAIKCTDIENGEDCNSISTCVYDTSCKSVSKCSGLDSVICNDKQVASEEYSCTWNGSQCVPDLSASNLKCSAIAQDDCGAVPYCNVVDNKCRLKTCLDAPDEATCNEELDSDDHKCAFNYNYCSVNCTDIENGAECDSISTCVYDTSCKSVSKCSGLGLDLCDRKQVASGEYICKSNDGKCIVNDSLKKPPCQFVDKSDCGSVSYCKNLDSGCFLRYCYKTPYEACSGLVSDKTYSCKQSDGKCVSDPKKCSDIESQKDCELADTCHWGKGSKTKVRACRTKVDPKIIIIIVCCAVGFVVFVALLGGLIFLIDHIKRSCGHKYDVCLDLDVKNESTATYDAVDLKESNPTNDENSPKVSSSKSSSKSSSESSGSSSSASTSASTPAPTTNTTTNPTTAPNEEDIGINIEYTSAFS